MARSPVLVATMTAAVFASSAAMAQSEAEKTAAAQALYERATAEMDKKDFARACPELEEVVRLIPSGNGAKVTLAECYEGAGKLASAWTSYTIAEEAAAKAKQIDRAKKAHDRAAALKPKLAQLTIVVDSDARGLKDLDIKRDGISVGTAQLGIPLPVDKGTHVVVATAAGLPKLERSIDVTNDGDSETFTISRASFVEEKVKAAPPPAVVADMSEPIAPPAGMSTMTKVGIAVGLVGAGGLVVGSIFGATALSKKSQSNDGHCQPDNHCDDIGLSLRDDGLRAGTLSTVFFVGGAAFLASGVVLLAIAPKSGRSHAQKDHIVLGLGRVGVEGTF